MKKIREYLFFFGIGILFILVGYTPQKKPVKKKLKKVDSTKVMKVQLTETMNKQMLMLDSLLLEQAKKDTTKN